MNLACQVSTQVVVPERFFNLIMMIKAGETSHRHRLREKEWLETRLEALRDQTENQKKLLSAISLNGMVTQSLVPRIQILSETAILARNRGRIQDLGQIKDLVTYG